LRAWRSDPARCARLHWAALSPEPPSRDALAAALACRDVPAETSARLLRSWPPAVPGVHRIELDGGRVRIGIAIGPPRRMLPGWAPCADALLVAVQDDRPDPPVLRAAAAALAADGVAGIALADLALRDAACATLGALSAAGLRCEAQPAPSGSADGPSAWRAVRARGRAAPRRPASARDALVVGGGLAGGATAAALARRGWSVVRVDAGLQHAQAGTLQPVLAQHPSVSPDDAPLSRLTRAATLLAPQVAGADALRPIGRVQCAEEADAEGAARGLHADWVRAVDAVDASSLAGVRLRRGGLWLPRACSADPLELLEAWTLSGVRPLEGRRVVRVERLGDAWRALDDAGATIAEAPVAVLAFGAGEVAVRTRPDVPPVSIAALLGPAGLQRRPGTTTVATPGASARPRCIVGGDGHAVPLGDGRLLLGPAGTQDGADDAPARAWRRWTGQLAGPVEAPPLVPGRTGVRVSTRDHLPIAGPLVEPGTLAPLDGLLVHAALGGRGLLWATLCAELLAATLEHEPLPVERALARALAPERFLVRALRRPDTVG
ncbi:MAG: FAD-dependent oxidoreductase, partial [Burkholderiales bacterium]|nr:FAD-dependent oxidoreductase [Burkholderiales bacterium]